MPVEGWDVPRDYYAPDPPDYYDLSLMQMAEDRSGDMSWDEFEQMLIQHGWTPEDAARERNAQEFGDLGDCDGDLA